MMKITNPNGKGKASASNTELKTLAKKHEKYSHNNNVFNDKNISDHTKVSKYYKVKAKPEEATKIEKVSS